MGRERLTKNKKTVHEKEYRIWLVSFCKKHPIWTDDLWNYEKRNISNDDLKNVQMLSEFFDFVLSFVEISERHPVDDYSEKIYCIINNVPFELETIRKKKRVTSIERLSEKPNGYAVIFKD